MAPKPLADEQNIDVRVGGFIRRGRLLLVVRPHRLALWEAPALPLSFGTESFEPTAEQAAREIAATTVIAHHQLQPGAHIERDVLGQPVSHQVVMWVECEFVRHLEQPLPPGFERAWIVPTDHPVHPLLQPFLPGWRLT